MDRDDADERQARIDTLIDEVRTKFEKAGTTAGQARADAQAARPRARVASGRSTRKLAQPSGRKKTKR